MITHTAITFRLQKEVYRKIKINIILKQLVPSYLHSESKTTPHTL